MPVPAPVPASRGPQWAALRKHLEGDRVNVRSFGAKGDGVTDDTAAFQSAVDAVAEMGGGTVMVPPGVYAMVASSPTIANPKRVLITHSNTYVRGEGWPTIRMLGIDKSYLDGQDDQSSSGRDIFTAFSFRRVTNCGIEGIRFEGTWDGVGSFRYASPRAKGAGFIGTTDCWAQNLYGEKILGNLVNATPSDITYDGGYRPLYRLWIDNCHAYMCLENGFNPMGNTFDVQIVNSSAQFCGSDGVEIGSTGYVVANGIWRYNKNAGVGASGSDGVVVGNVVQRNGHYVKTIAAQGEFIAAGGETVAGTGILCSAGASNTIANNLIADNDGVGLHAYTGVRDLRIRGNEFRKNATLAPYKYAIYANGTPGAWNAGTTYGLGAYVRDAGANYRSLQATNLNHATSDGAWWVLDETPRITGLRITGNDMSSADGVEVGFISAAYLGDALIAMNDIVMPAAATNSIALPAATVQGIVMHNSVNKPISFVPTDYMGIVAFNPGDSATFSGWTYQAGLKASKVKVSALSGVQQGFNSRPAPTNGSAVTIDIMANGPVVNIPYSNAAADFAMNNPTGGGNGQQIVLQFINTSGGNLGTITWGTEWAAPPSWPALATGYRRTIIYQYDASGPKWYPVSPPVDVAN